MESSRLIETLRQIGYPNAGSLDPNSLDWALEQDATRPFLRWFCNNVSLENVVTEQELKQFSQLEARGAILTGQQLEENLEPLKDLRLDEDHLRSDIKELQAKLEAAKARKNLLLKRTNQLSDHHVAQKNRVVKLRAVGDQSQKKIKKSLEKCTAVNSQLDTSIEKLSSSVSALTELYCNTPATKTRPDFLSQAELKAFHDAEERFSKDLTAFTKKQFFNGVADLTADKESTQYSLLDVSQSNVSHSRDPVMADDAFHSDCQEFARIQKIFPQSECDCINALINTKKAASAVQEAQSILHQLKTNQFPKCPQIIQRHHNAEQGAAFAQSEAAPLLSALPDMIRDLGQLQGTKVLTGDYNLKLRRQDYFSQNQEKVIEHLVSQRARNEFLSMLYEMEIRWHKETHRLVSAARQALEAHLLSWQQRTKDLSDPDLQMNHPEASVVDVRDSSTSRLHQLMDTTETDGDKPLYLQTQKVVTRANAMTSEVDGDQLSCDLMEEKYGHMLDQLATVSEDCASLVYNNSGTSRGRPNLSQLDIQVAMTTLRGQLSQLDRCIKDCVDDIDAKKTALKNNVLLGKERELFVLFHTNPDRLHYIVNGLADRAKAQGLQESS